MRALASILPILLAACGPAVPPADTDPAIDPTDTDESDTDTDSDADADTDADTDADADTDPIAQARAACYATVDQLRASASKRPYARWTSGEACADAAATSDEQTGVPHGAFGSCGELGQNECLGAGAAGVASCLQGMWDERLQAGCSGCGACSAAYDPGCPGCDFYGQATGDVCGHYVNLNAGYYSEVACGFTALGGWVVVNFR